MVEKQWDAIIAGAGPAGASLAVQLARAGWQVMLVDRSAFPRQKVCGEFLGAAIWPWLDTLGVADSVERQAQPIEHLDIVLPSGRRLTVPLGGAGRNTVPAQNNAARKAVALSRWVFDDLFIAAARRSGVEVLLEHSVEQVVIENDRAVAVRVRPVRSTHPGDLLRARVIIAADGRQSTVVRQTGLVRSRPTGLVGFKHHWNRSAELSPPAPLLEMHGGVRGYLGICPVESGIINLCGLMPAEIVQRSRGSIESALADWGFSVAASRLLADAEPSGDWKTTTEVSRQRAEPVVAGVLYVGDAQATIEPIAGQGMTVALAGSALAAKALVTAGPLGVDPTFQSHYRNACQSAFGRQIRISRPLAWLLRHPDLVGCLAALAGPWPAIERAILGRAYHATRIRARP